MDNDREKLFLNTDWINNKQPFQKDYTFSSI